MAVQVSEALPHDELRYEPVPKWVRAERGGEPLADSRAAILVWEPQQVVPLYAFPRADVRAEALSPAAEPSDWHKAPLAEEWDVTGGGGTVAGGAWRVEDPVLADFVVLRWDAADRWLEEEEEIVAHPRDPFKRVDVRPSSRHVVVELNGELVADSRRPLLLFETGLPVRYYLPRSDVRGELLEESETSTYCAYKGEASYFSIRAGGELHSDVVWTYPDPLPDSPQIKDYLAFFNERVDITVDGEPAGRPQTQWSARSGLSEPPP